MKKQKITLLASLLALTVTLAACGDSVTRENFERIENDMTQEQVTGILGEPDEFDSIELGNLSGSTARWIGDTHAITVTFGNKRVALKSFGELPPAKK